MSHKYSKSYFHDAEQLRRFVDDSKDKFTLSAGGQIVELDFHAAVKMNSTILSNGVAIDEPDHVNGDVNNKVMLLIIKYTKIMVKIIFFELLRHFLSFLIAIIEQQYRKWRCRRFIKWEEALQSRRYPNR